MYLWIFGTCVLTGLSNDFIAQKKQKKAKGRRRRRRKKWMPNIDSKEPLNNIRLDTRCKQRPPVGQPKTKVNKNCVFSFCVSFVYFYYYLFKHLALHSLCFVLCALCIITDIIMCQKINALLCYVYLKHWYTGTNES